MKNYILCLFFLLTLNLNAENLEGKWVHPSRDGRGLEVIIRKSDTYYYFRIKKQYEVGYTTYSTNLTYLEDGINYMFGEKSMQGRDSTLPDKCRLKFYAKNGEVDIHSMTADIGGTTYSLMYMPADPYGKLRKSSTPQNTQQSYQQNNARTSYPSNVNQNNNHQSNINGNNNNSTNTINGNNNQTIIINNYR